MLVVFWPRASAAGSVNGCVVALTENCAGSAELPRTPICSVLEGASGGSIMKMFLWSSLASETRVEKLATPSMGRISGFSVTNMSAEPLVTLSTSSTATPAPVSYV